jgi:hypothetical protein
MKKTDKVIKVLKSDRNEVRYHTSTRTVSVFYKNRKWLSAGWEIARRMVGVK